MEACLDLDKEVKKFFDSAMGPMIPICSPEEQRDESETLEKVVAIARNAHNRYWSATSDEATGDRQARKVTEVWQEQVIDRLGDRFQKEFPVSPDLNERIDLVDVEGNVAYELKVSGKNPDHEFYKDIFKVMVYNRRRQSQDPKIKKLVFITEEGGAAKLQRGLGQAVIEAMPRLGLTIVVKGIRSK